ncbi:hypothetical protein [Actinosynnema sp. NPDC023587]|uniref:hypothetical protein n=1 Tax=Actinosynnema sp. NPDC023587 TaxID=3154695 RepID=UPI0033C50315
MDLQNIGRGARPDARLHRRVEHAVQVGVVPARCKRGLHHLHGDRYTASITDGELRVSCAACFAEPNPDHSWVLTFDGPAPDRLVLDDAPYARAEPHFVQRPVSAR